MAGYNFPLLVTVILLFPMFYFAIVSLTFFLRRFDDPTVTWMLRGLFSLYFRVVEGCCWLAAAVFALAGRPAPVLGLAILLGCTIAARRWFLGHMDSELRARDAGDARATGRLRRLHVGGILYNATQGAAVIAAIPMLLAPAA